MISSFRWANQLSCRVWISSLRRSFCSAVRPATQAALSNLVAGASGLPLMLPLPVASTQSTPCLAAAFGAAKKDMMLAFCLGFLASDPACESALRLRVDMLGGLRA